MKTDKIFNFLYAFGAAIVIFGAWQKITHRPLADIFLTLGLLTEVVLFVIMAFQELFKKSSSEIVSYTKTEKIDNSVLTDSLNNLNQTIKQVFNR